MTSYTPPSQLSATVLVAEREIRMRLRSRAFLISTLLLLVGILASIVIGGLAGQNPEKTKIAAVGSAVAAVEAVGAFEVTTVDTVASAEALVKSKDVDAAVVPSGDGLTVIGFDSAPGDVVSALSVPPEVRLLEPSDQSPLIIYFVAIAFGIVFFLSAITFGQVIAQSVVEEKQTRIVEILMAAVPVRVLLAGKILGNSVLAFAQIIAIAALSGVALLATGQDLLLADIGSALLWFIVLFAAGFVLLASLYAATAALVSRQEDLASAVSPVTTLIMIPYVLVILFNDDPFVLGIMSYVPFSAPVGMPMRVFLGTAEWWEPIVSLAILVASAVIVTGIGSRIYSNGLLRTGAKVKLADALRGA